MSNVTRRLVCSVDPSWPEGSRRAATQAIEICATGRGATHPAHALPTTLTAPGVAVAGEVVELPLTLVNPARAPATFCIFGAAAPAAVCAMPSEGTVPPQGQTHVRVAVALGREGATPFRGQLQCCFEHGATQLIEVHVPHVRAPELDVDTAPLRFGTMRLGASAQERISLLNPSATVPLAWRARVLPSLAAGVPKQRTHIALPASDGVVPPSGAAALEVALIAASPGPFAGTLEVTTGPHTRHVLVSAHIAEPRLRSEGGVGALDLGRVYEGVPVCRTVTLRNDSDVAAEWSLWRGGAPVGNGADYVQLRWSAESGSVAPGEALCLEVHALLTQPCDADCLVALGAVGARAPAVLQLIAECRPLEVTYAVEHDAAMGHAASERRAVAAGIALKDAACEEEHTAASVGSIAEGGKQNAAPDGAQPVGIVHLGSGQRDITAAGSVDVPGDAGILPLGTSEVEKCTAAADAASDAPGEEQEAPPIIDFGRAIPINQARSAVVVVRNSGGISAPVRFWVDEFPAAVSRGGAPGTGMSTKQAQTGSGHDDVDGGRARMDTTGIELGAERERNTPFRAAAGNEIVQRRQAQVRAACCLCGAFRPRPLPCSLHSRRFTTPAHAIRCVTPAV